MLSDEVSIRTNFTAVWIILDLEFKGMDHPTYSSFPPVLILTLRSQLLVPINRSNC